MLLSSLDASFLGFEHNKELYVVDSDFNDVYEMFLRSPHDKFFLNDGYLFREDKFCIPKASMQELLVREAHGGGLMGHFGGAKFEYIAWTFIGLIWIMMLSECVKGVWLVERQNLDKNHMDFILHSYS